MSERALKAEAEVEFLAIPTAGLRIYVSSIV